MAIFPILDDEQMSNWVGIKHLPVKFFSIKPGTFDMKGIHPPHIAGVAWISGGFSFIFQFLEILQCSYWDVLLVLSNWVISPLYK